MPDALLPSRTRSYRLPPAGVKRESLLSRRGDSSTLTESTGLLGSLTGETSRDALLFRDSSLSWDFLAAIVPTSKSAADKLNESSFSDKGDISEL